MKYFALVFLIACATRKPPLAQQKDDLVRVSTVMDQVQFSYMKGCVDTYKELKLGPAFETCRARAKDHRLEIQSIMDQELR